MHNTAEDIKQVFLSQIDQKVKDVNGHAGHVGLKLREYARTSFDQGSFPTRKDEDWKYTSVKAILAEEYNGASKSEFTCSIPDQFEATTLCFLNGVLVTNDEHKTKVANGGEDNTAAYVSSGSQEGFFAGSLSVAMANPELKETLSSSVDKICNTPMGIFESMGLGINEDPVCIVIPDNAQVSKPIHLIYATDSKDGATASHPYALIIVGKNAKAEIVESYLPQADNGVYYTNTASRIFVGANGHLDHYRLQVEGKEAFHTAQSTIHQDRDSTYGVYIAELGGKLMRNNIHVSHDSENITSNIYGLFVVQGSQHMDTQSFIDHAKPHCLSNELIKGVLHDRGRGVFNGKIIVRPDAQKINAYQHNAALVLSPDAVMDSKPQLEIFADDVKCSHGATIGQLNPDALFYLKTRGLSDDAAKTLLKNAFLKDVIDHFPNRDIALYFESYLEKKLTQISIKNATEKAIS
ncbi:MAG: Fe-S cluster assembly protein SufD [Bacteroidetes bacterium]|nr:MAG: Fe-S cluster assembly protein SufD [Bacteroidota bacterium]